MPKIRIRFAIGAARTTAELSLVPDLIKAAADLANCCVNIPEGPCGLPDAALTMAAAQCCEALCVCVCACVCALVRVCACVFVCGDG